MQFLTDERGRIMPAPDGSEQGPPQNFLQRLSRASLTSPRGQGTTSPPPAPQQQLANLGPAGGFPAGGRT